MILQALKTYYDRKADELPPPGWVEKGIDFAVVLRPDGTLHGVQCRQEPGEKRPRPHPSLVPMIGKQALKHTNSGVDANLLWDNAKFVLGTGKKAAKSRASFQAALEVWLGDVDDEGVRAVRAFYANGDADPGVFERILADPDYGETLQSGAPILAFSMIGEPGFVHDREAVHRAVGDKWEHLTDNGGPGICLVTGRRENLEDCHLVTKGVWGAQTSGANLISFNAAAFESYGLRSGANAPVGKTSSFAYGTALNHLLRPGSLQRMQIGDASTVFWGEGDTPLEEGMAVALDGGFDAAWNALDANPDRRTQEVSDLFKSVENGELPPLSGDIRFHVLGLAPNAARLAVRFWITATVREMADRIIQHFNDLRIVHGPRDPDSLKLFHLLVSTAAQGKAENITPNLAGAVMRAILSGAPYPRTLLQSALLRNRAEQNVSYARTALIKACLVRDPHFKEELKVSLDLGNTNIGYRLGRLFATLEKVQQEANPGLNATIRDRYYGAASGTPVAVFSNLMRLKNHHLAKLENPGRRVSFEKLIAEILDGVEAATGFPSALSMDEQGCFAIGYYHQMQSFYTKKDKTTSTESTSSERENDHE